MIRPFDSHKDVFIPEGSGAVQLLLRACVPSLGFNTTKGKSASTTSPDSDDNFRFVMLALSIVPVSVEINFLSCSCGHEKMNGSLS